MKNYLIKFLDKYFEEILLLEGKLTVLESFLISKKDDIIKENRLNKHVVSSITSYRDLSLLNSTSNLFIPNHDYLMSIDNMKNEVKDIISQQCCFAISQAYEVFENYLIEILTEYLLFNQDKLKLLKFTQSDIILIRDTIRKMVKEKQKTNNRGILAMVRKLSGHFNLHEVKNIYKVNISQWFDLLSMIRHTLVHNRQVVSDGFLKYLQKHQANKIFEAQFKRKRIGKKICIYLEKNTASDIIHWLNSFAHFIFVSLSMEGKLSLHIPQFQPPPLNPTRLVYRNYKI